uniref:Chitin-binding type-2 domain-containing protein n=1 Tax=Anopheles farauti TaxID=69004 RepID=A0A182Q2C5_9DIPT
MWRTVATTVVVTFGLAAVLEAAYLERPLWVADKGKPLSFGTFANEESRLSQALASQGTEQQWLIPEPYNPQPTGHDNVRRPEDVQWPSQESSYTEQKVREERPTVGDSFQLNRPFHGQLPYYGQPEFEHQNTEFYYEQRVENKLQSAQLNQWQQQLEHRGPSYSSEQTVQEKAKPWQTKPEVEFRAPYYGQQSWNVLPKPEDAQLQYQWREEQQTMPDNNRESSYAASKPSLPSRQPVPDVFKPNQQTPDLYKPVDAKPDFVKPDTDLLYQRSQEAQQFYDSYQPRPETYKPSASFSGPSYQLPQFNPYQPSPSKPEPERHEPSQSKPESYEPFAPKPEPEMSYQAQSQQELQQSYGMYNKYPEALKPSLSFSEPNYSLAPKPELQFQPNPPKPMQQYPEPILPKPTDQQPPMQLPERERPQDSQQAYNPHPARPEMYKPSPDFSEPSYQIPYMNQVVAQPNQPLPELYTRQNWGQAQANTKPNSVPTKPEQGGSKVKKPVIEYQSPQGSLNNLEYNQNQLAGEDNFPSYKPSRPVNSVVQAQTNRQPTQPQRNQPPRPVRPVEPNRSPSPSWEGSYQPEQPAPIKKPAPPAPLLMSNNPPRPTYNRQPESYFGEDEYEEVKYELPAMHLDVRCPRDDDPSKPVHIPSATSCDKFQKCYNGIAYEMSCPPGLQFDVKNSRCDYAARVNCSL